jgi:glutamate racemase
MGQNIGVFDSGLGGLSVYRETKKLLPEQKIVYYADSRNAPYGTKNQKEIRKLTTNAIQFLASRRCEIIVIACNTATTGGIGFYRRRFPNSSFVGVVPPIKPAAKASKSKKIVVLSTAATAKSKYLKNLVKEFASGCKVWNFGCPKLVEAVENGTTDDDRTRIILKKYLDKPLKDGADTVVLGCTHFPFLKDVIRKIYGRKIKILDPSKPVAVQTNKLSKNTQRDTSKITRGKDCFYTSGNAKRLTKVASKLLKRRVGFRTSG